MGLPAADAAAVDFLGSIGAHLGAYEVLRESQCLLYISRLLVLVSGVSNGLLLVCMSQGYSLFFLRSFLLCEV